MIVLTVQHLGEVSNKGKAAPVLTHALSHQTGTARPKFKAYTGAVSRPRRPGRAGRRGLGTATRRPAALGNVLDTETRSPCFLRYDLAFIDGLHTNDQVTKDFFAIEPYLADRAVVVLHDVGFFNLHSGVATFPSEWRRHVPRGRSYKNLMGTVVVERGFPAGFFAGL